MLKSECDELQKLEEKKEPEDNFEKESEKTRRRLYLVIWMTDAMGDFQWNS